MSESKIPIPSGPKEPGAQETDAERADGASRNQGQPRQGFIQRTWGWVTGKHEHIRDWLIAVFTLALTIATFFYVHYAGQQRDAMIDAVRESKRASDAAEKAVEIAEQTRRDSEKAAREATERAERATVASENAARSMAIQADASKQSAEFARESAGVARQSLIAAQRPVIGVVGVHVEVEEGKQLFMEVTFQNTGRTAARQGRSGLTPIFEDVRADVDDRCPEPKSRQRVGTISMNPVAVNVLQRSEWRFGNPLSKDAVSAIKDRRTWLYIWWRYEYQGLTGEKYFTEYYSRYNPKTERFDMCQNHNDAN